MTGSKCHYKHAAWDKLEVSILMRADVAMIEQQKRKNLTSNHSVIWHLIWYLRTLVTLMRFQI